MSLRHWLAEAGGSGPQGLGDGARTLSFAALVGKRRIGGGGPAIDGHNVLVWTGTQLAAAAALVELDGRARRIVLCPPDLKPEHLPALLREAEIDIVVADGDAALPELDSTPVATVSLEAAGIAAPSPSERERDTEWVLLTSGTTGVPKMAVHTLAGLTGAMLAGKQVGATQDPTDAAEPSRPVVWGTFYDIRRYGGLQILLRALTGGRSLVLSRAGEDLSDHLGRLARAGVTYLSGTPSHWRRVLMSADVGRVDPAYVRLSGEIADQAVLDGLKGAFPRARIGHAYASTEAGVAFEVEDGLEGFPASFLGRRGDVEMKIEDGSLRIRSPRAAVRYLARGDAATLADPDGWVDTDDMVERRGERCFFVGRRSGVINVGGLKVHPEEVEAVINRHRHVRMSLVRAKTNPITGAIVVADVVLTDDAEAPAGGAALKGEILAICRGELPQHKVPVLLRIVDRLAVTAAGKLARSHA